jgi:hypothetical protein
MAVPMKLREGGVVFLDGLVRGLEGKRLIGG